MTEGSDAEVLAEFKRRTVEGWLPTFCHDSKRNLAVCGFRQQSIDKVSTTDARDCMYAIDKGLISDVGGGRYRAPQSQASEELFWAGRRKLSPQPLTLWVEPVITFAALTRLHRDCGWPAGLLGTQPRTLPHRWAFDIAAHEPSQPSQYRILGEVKKTRKEAERLLTDLLRLSEGDPGEVRINSRNKWEALRTHCPTIFWTIGPGGYSKVMTVSHSDGGSSITLTEGDEGLMTYPEFDSHP
jgi:hypothetical protein